ncbi:MAG: phosphohydrolase, partial [Candidatus Omnitrophica bacterium]|nr:phosphohydrolase [Candidatus Omnitrophota bacterium]
MIFECPGAKIFKQPKPEGIICPCCGREAEIWTDEVRIACPGCKKPIIRQQGQSCLDWCKFAKDCVGE